MSPPPNAKQISETFTYSFERKEHFIPLLDSVTNTETSTPSTSLPISTIPSLSPWPAFTAFSSAFVIYVKDTFPSSKIQFFLLQVLLIQNLL